MAVAFTKSQIEKIIEQVTSKIAEMPEDTYTVELIVNVAAPLFAKSIKLPAPAPAVAVAVGTVSTEKKAAGPFANFFSCLLYTSDAADE